MQVIHWLCVCVYRVFPVMRILLGSMTLQARPAVWMVRRAELSCTMYAQIRDSGSRPACCRGGGGSCGPTGTKHTHFSKGPLQREQLIHLGVHCGYLVVYKYTVNEQTHNL